MSNLSYDVRTYPWALRRRYGDTYKFQICGRQVIVVTHPEGISSLYQDVNKAFNTFELFSRIMNILSGTKDPVHLFDIFERKLHRVMALNLSPSMSITHGKDISRMLVSELNAMTCDDLPITLNLYDFISRPLYMAGCDFLFGSTFPSAETFEDFRMVDQKISETPLMASLPFVVPDGLRARERLCSHLDAYIQPWWDSNGSHGLLGISDLMLQSLEAMKESNLSKEEATALNILFAFGFHSNTWYTLFWLMVQLIHDDGLMEKIRSEINLNNPQLIDPDDNSGEGLYPILNSVIEETFRWAGRTSTIRRAEKDTGLTQDGKFIPVRKGEYVVADVRALHFNPQRYPDGDNFKFDRYLTSATSEGTPPSKPLAWGGGKHGVSFLEFFFQPFVVITVTLHFSVSGATWPSIKSGNLSSFVFSYTI